MSVEKEQFDRNISRVNNLIELFDIAKNSHHRHSVKEADILRAAIVFLHSSFEDYLRAIIIKWLPTKGNDDALGKICLYGHEGRMEKFSIANLKPYKDLSVSELVTRSVEDHMHKVSFNDTTDIYSYLKRILIDTTNLRDADRINGMIKRRHKIVHEMDRNPARGRGQHQAQSIDKRTIMSMVNVVETWVAQIDTQVNAEGYM